MLVGSYRLDTSSACHSGCMGDSKKPRKFTVPGSLRDFAFFLQFSLPLCVGLHALGFFSCKWEDWQGIGLTPSRPKRIIYESLFLYNCEKIDIS